MGSAKATYFESRGYSLEAPQVLEEALREVARTGRVASMEALKWGTKYYVVGSVEAPDGNPMTVGTVWIVAEDAPPVLVTAYPTRR